MNTNTIDNKTAFNSDVIAGARDANANCVKLSGAATTLPPVVEAIGDDTNIDLKLQPKGSGAVVFSSAEGGNGSIALWADEGDDAADKWTLAALAASASLTITNGGATTAPFTLAPGSLTVTAADAGNADLVLQADKSDDSGDDWTIRSAASGNALTFLNEASAVATLSSVGLLTTILGVRTSGVALNGYATGAGGAVTQLVDSTTAVQLDKPCGQITTVALTTAAGAEEEFTVNNSLVAATDVIGLSTTYAGAGTPMLSVKGLAAGSFKIVITNVHTADALNALMVINFAVTKAVAA